MNVALELETESHDITGYLDDEQDIELGQEHELKAFQRTVDDIRLRCSNQHNDFTSWLGSPSSVKPRIVVKDEGRTLFRGEIQQPISFDVRDEWTSFDCFSMTKAFWDLCQQLKVTKAVPAGKENDLWTTAGEVITREITMERFGHLIAGYQIAAAYLSRPIRFWGYTADQAIGNNGRYKDLDPRTTLDELLKAMMLYYNADIFIDPETQLLVMQMRDEIQNDINHQLDDVLDEEDEITPEVYDEKVDYIALTLNLGKPTAPVPKSTDSAGTGKGLDPGWYKWACTYLYRSGDLLIESELGDESPSQAVPISRNNTRYIFHLELPLGSGGCVGRRVYRTTNTGMGRFFLTGALDNNSDTLFDDATPNSELQVPAPTKLTTGTVWLRYDEETGIWDEPLMSDSAGLNTPAGEIHEVTPKLRFLSKPFGNALEIAAIYAYDGKTRIRTTDENGFEAGLGINIQYSSSSPVIDGGHLVLEVFPDRRTFSIDGPAVTSPSTGGTVTRWMDKDKEEPLDTASENLFDVFAFFGNEKDRLGELQSQWINLFRSRIRVKCTVKGLAFRLGDSASLNRKYNGLTIGKCVIKKAKNKLMKERTQLELLTL